MNRKYEYILRNYKLISIQLKECLIAKLILLSEKNFVN